MAEKRRKLTPHAAAAKMIKQHLKGLGITCSVKSESFSMGSAVRVQVYDQTPNKLKEITEYCDQFSYSRYNIMEDYHDNNNSRDDIPQAKYVTISNDYNENLRQECWEYIRTRYAEADELPEKLTDVSHSDRVSEDWATSFHHQILNGSRGEFWQNRSKADEPEPLTEPPTPTSGALAIEEHTHTKKGFQMFICIMTDRVERSEFITLREKARELGGWYSRPWGVTPGGFAFKNRSKADEFCGDDEVAPRPPAVDEHPQSRSRPDTSKAERLRTLADKMTGAIDDKMGDRMTNTPKRVAQAAHTRLEGERLQRVQQALYALADLYRVGEVPEILRRFTSKKSIYEQMGTVTEPVQNGYHSYHYCTGKPNKGTPEALTLWGLIDGKSEEQKSADDLRRRVEGLQFSNIPGYYPTPPEIVARMIDLADIEDHLAVLEPEAGSGAIAKALNGHKGRKVAMELNYSLFEITRDSLPDWKVYQGDFTAETPSGVLNPGFDRILMNPPFEKGADIKHIKHALQFLREGGRLVAICAGGPRQVEELQSLATHWEDLPERSFKGAGTNVNTCLMVIDK